MTRDEAINRLKSIKEGWSREWLVDALIALDLLKVEEPPPADWRRMEFVHIVATNVVVTTPEGFIRTDCASKLYDEFDKAGLAIVRKEDVK